MKKRIVIVFIVFVLVVASMGQTDSSPEIQSGAGIYKINGQVYDENGESIPAAHIFLPHESIGASADIDGNYSLEVGPGVHTFRTSAIGYAQIDTTFAVSGSKKVDFILPSKALVADPVIVTTSRVEQRLLDAPITTTVADGDIVESQVTIDIADALRQIPGITMNKYQISIRNSSGFSQGAGSRVAMLIDGVPVLAGDTGEIKWDALPTKALNQIEVVKGAGSSLYGSGALGGVVNIVTKTPAKNELKVFGKLGVFDEPFYEQWDWTDKTLMIKNAGFLWGYKRTEAVYLATAEITASDGYREGDDFIRSKSFMKMRYDISSNKSLTAFGNIAYEDRASYFQWKSPEEALSTEEGRMDDRVWSSKAFGALIYRGDAPKRHLFLTTRIYNSFNNFYSHIFNTQADTNEIQASRSNKAGADAQIMFTWGKNIFNSGAELSLATNVSEMFGDRLGYGGAVFFQDEFSMLHPLVLNGGIRLDMFMVDSAAADYFMGFSPKVSAIYHTHENSAVRCNFSSGFRIPTMAELFTRTNAGGILRVQPNPDLEPEQGYTAEIGANFVKNGFLIDGAVFYNYYSEMIEAQPIYGTLVEFQNIREVEIYGTEITGKFHWQRIYLSANYLYTNSTDLETKDRLPYRPDHSINFSAGYNLLKNLTIGADYIYKSERDYGLFRGDAKVPIKVIDLYARYSIGSMQFTTRINNATNYNYTEVERNLAPIRHLMLSAEYSIF